jgi:LPS sulfotransferase NodH
MHDKKRGKTAVILARARSGTTVFREVLRSHPEIKCYDEVFNPAPRKDPSLWPAFHLMRKDLIINKPEYIAPFPDNNKALLHEFLDLLESKSKDHITIFDIKYGQAHQLNPFFHPSGAEPFLLRQLKAEGVLFLHVIRENILAAVVSYKIAEANNEYRAFKADDIGIRQIHLHPKKLLKTLNDRSREIEFMRTTLRQYELTLEIHYEDMVRKGRFSEEILNNVCDSLNIEFDFTLRPRREKVAPPLAESIENINEIKAALEGSPYEWMLH